MTTFVQITGCVAEEGAVAPFVSNEDADFYAVYVAEPGECHWQADFLHYDDALTYAMAINKHHGYPIDDKTYNDGDFKNVGIH